MKEEHQIKMRWNKQETILKGHPTQKYLKRGHQPPYLSGRMQTWYQVTENKSSKRTLAGV